jgi:hypothetical protein
VTWFRPRATPGFVPAGVCPGVLPATISSGDLNVFPAVALNFENLVAKVLPITISSAAMVKEKGRMIGIGIFELDEHFSTPDNPAALCARLYFRHCFLTYRGLEQDFAMLDVNGSHAGLSRPSDAGSTVGICNQSCGPYESAWDGQALFLVFYAASKCGYRQSL